MAKQFNSWSKLPPQAIAPKTVGGIGMTGDFGADKNAWLAAGKAPNQFGSQWSGAFEPAQNDYRDAFTAARTANQDAMQAYRAQMNQAQNQNFTAAPNSPFTQPDGQQVYGLLGANNQVTNRAVFDPNDPASMALLQSMNQPFQGTGYGQQGQFAVQNPEGQWGFNNYSTFATAPTSQPQSFNPQAWRQQNAALFDAYGQEKKNLQNVGRNFGISPRRDHVMNPNKIIGYDESGNPMYIPRGMTSNEYYGSQQQSQPQTQIAPPSQPMTFPSAPTPSTIANAPTQAQDNVPAWLKYVQQNGAFGASGFKNLATQAINQNYPSQPAMATPKPVTNVKPNTFIGGGIWGR